MKREMMESRNTGAAERSFFYFFTAGWRRRGRNWRREDDWGGRRRGRVVLLEQMSFQPPTLRVTVRFWLEWEGHFSPEWDGRTGPRTDEGKSSFISWSELGRSQDKFKKVSGVFPASCGSLQRNSQFHLWLYFGYSIGIKCRRVYLNRSVTTCWTQFLKNLQLNTESFLSLINSFVNKPQKYSVYFHLRWRKASNLCGWNAGTTYCWKSKLLQIDFLFCCFVSESQIETRPINSNISTSIRWLAMKLGPDVHVSFRMSRNNFGSSSASIRSEALFVWSTFKL